MNGKQSAGAAVFQYRALSRHLPGWTEENHEYLSQDGRSSGRYFNPGTPEYKVVLRVQTTQLKLSVQTLDCMMYTCRSRSFSLLGLLSDFHRH
jgi:hypothetical protein